MARSVPSTLAAVALLLPLLGATADPPAEAAIRAAFRRLADPDPAVRDAAREQLMGLSRDELTTLADVVRSAGPLRPDQVASLYPVVVQAFLAADDYPVIGADIGSVRYFLGIHWTAEDAGNPRTGTAPERVGVPATDRWPGFPAGRFLREGDFILGVYLDRTRPLEQQPNRVTHTTTALIQAVEAARDHPDIELSVLRDGRVLRVSIRMAPKPAVADVRGGVTDDGVAFFALDRQRRADAYWHDTFAPMVPANAGNRDGEDGDARPSTAALSLDAADPGRL